MTLLTRQPQRQDSDVEALIKEARARQRRRRLIRTAAVVVLLSAVIVSLSVGVARPKKLVTPPTSSSNRPTVDVRAVRDDGNLAFISRNVLWTIDGGDGTLRPLPTVKGFAPTSPRLSSDGKWLAYLESRTTNYSEISNLWIARGNGTDVREVAKSVGELVGWSPTSDILAFTSTIPVTFASTAEPEKVLLFSPTDAVKELVGFGAVGDRAPVITGASWSPKGNALAVSTSVEPSGRTSVLSYPIAGGAPTTWFSISNTAVLPGLCTGCGGHDTIATVTGWWPGWGIGFWAVSSGAVRNLDATPLELVTAPGVTPHIIGDTLSDGTTVAYASDAHGELVIVASTSTAGREFGQGKTVDVCNRSSLRCAPLPGASVWTGRPLPCVGLECTLVPRVGSPGSGVSIDPSWSPNGSLLAYEKAPTVPNDQVSNAVWYNAHELYLWNAKTNTSKKIDDVDGATVPVWSKNGEDLLYVDNNALWLWHVDGGEPTRIASPLFLPSQWIANKDFQFSFFEQVNFLGQFSWWSR